MTGIGSTITRIPLTLIPHLHGLGFAQLNKWCPNVFLDTSQTGEMTLGVAEEIGKYFSFRVDKRAQSDMMSSSQPKAEFSQRTLNNRGLRQVFRLHCHPLCRNEVCNPQVAISIHWIFAPKHLAHYEKSRCEHTGEWIRLDNPTAM